MAYEALKKLQERCGCTPDGGFGPNTARSIVKHFELTPERGAHLLGQVVHESGTFRYNKENLSYSVSAMMKVWPSRFPTEESAKPYEYQAKALANKVYSNRMGNGDNEGADFIGRGFLQITGKSNYKSFASDMGLPEVMTDMSLMEEEYAFDTAIWFFQKNKLWTICDDGVNEDAIKRLTRRINGGYTGLDHRVKETYKIYEWLR